MTLITLYDVSAYVAPYWLMVLFQRFWRWLTAISRAEWLMADEQSSLGEVVMLGAVSIERRELVYGYIRKSTTFHPPPSGPSHQVGPRSGASHDCGAPSTVSQESLIHRLPLTALTSACKSHFVKQQRSPAADSPLHAITR